jgi:hypothetical protein
MGSEITKALATRATRCLAAGQQLCTAQGAIAVDELAKRASFEVVSYDLATRRCVVKPAKAIGAGRKAALRLHTDKAGFDLTADQGVMLEHGVSMAAAGLEPGMRLCACAVKPELSNLVRSADFGKERVDLNHLTPADCAVANWYPVPSLEALGEREVYQVDVQGGAADGQLSNVLIWTLGPGGGIGIVVLA